MCNVFSAANGQEGVEKVESSNPDVVFLDILMPVLDGMSASEIIRKKHKELPVFMLTAFSTEDRKSEAERVGQPGLVLKTAILRKK